MIYLVSSIKASASKIQLPSFHPSIFITLLLFGQVFFSTLSYFLGVENRLFILPFRGLIALYSLYVVLRNIATNRSIFLEAFPLSLAAFWFVYFAKLLLDHFILGVSIALPIWEFSAWGIGGCFLPSFACYLLSGNSISRRGQYSMPLLSWGLFLLGSSALFFVFSGGLNLQHRFELPSLNSINVSHSFFVLSLFALSCLVYRHCSTLKSLYAAVVCAFGILMGISAGSRGALLAFICSCVVIFLVSNFNKLWALILLASSAVLLAQFDPSGLLVRLTAAGSDLNSILRLSAILESMRVFWAHPFVGAGFGYHLNLSASVGSSQMWYPHNLISESLALGGIVLTIPLISCILLSVCSCIRFWRSSSSSELWRVALLVQAFGYVTFSGHLSNVPMFWIALGLASSLTPLSMAKTQSRDLL